MLTNFIRLLSIWRDTAFQFFPSHQIPFKGNGTYMLELNRKAISHHALLPVRTLDFRFYLTPFCFMLFSSIWSISLLYVASLYHSNKNDFFILAFFFCLSLWLFFRFFPGWFVFEFVLFLLIIHFVYFSGILFFFFSIILWLLFDGFHFPFNGFHVSAIPIVVFRYFFFFFFWFWFYLHFFLYFIFLHFSSFKIYFFFSFSFIFVFFFTFSFFSSSL